MKPKKLLCLVLALAMLLLTACGGRAEETTAPFLPPETTEPARETLPAELGDGEMSPTAEAVENPVDNPITYFSMSIGENADHIRYLVAYEDFGETYVEYLGQEKKVARFGVSFLHRLTEQVDATAVVDLNGRSEYAEGDPLGSLYVTYADGTYLTADFSGLVPAEFTDAYEIMDAWFADRTAQLPEYIPQPMIMGDVDPDAQAEMLAILEASGIRELDQFAISDIPMDDYFTFTAGLSRKEGILNGTMCSAMMMTTPYSFVIVTAREEGQVEAIREDFRDSMNWNKWVCVLPSDALIAQKGNMVLCLMGIDVLYHLTEAGIEASGWTEIETFPNPDM